MTLQMQAEHIANVLRADLVEFLARLPAADVITYASSPVFRRIAVPATEQAGRKASSSASALRSIARRTDGRCRVRSLARLTFSECGVRFHGQESVLSVLRTDTGVRIPKAELQHSDVARLAGLLKGECGEATTRSASAMFLQAVRLTVTLGPGFGVPQGAVSLPIYIITIPRDGPIETTRITSWYTTRNTSW